MFMKLLAIVFAVALIALLWLTMRQQRLETAHDIARVHQRLLQHETALWSLQADIAAHSRPEDIRRRMEALDVEWDALEVELAEDPPVRAPVVDPLNAF